MSCDVSVISLFSALFLFSGNAPRLPHHEASAMRLLQLLASGEVPSEGTVRSVAVGVTGVLSFKQYVIWPKFTGESPPCVSPRQTTATQVCRDLRSVFGFCAFLCLQKCAAKSAMANASSCLELEKGSRTPSSLQNTLGRISISL